LLSAYSFTPLDVPGAVQDGGVYGINDQGAVVGYYLDNSGRWYGYVKDSSGYTTIDATSLGASRTFAQGINNAGQVVGQYYDARGIGHGFLEDAGDYSRVDPPGTTYTVASRINSSGKIVGWYNDASEASHGFLKDGSGYHLVDVPGASSMGVWDVNDTGVLVGSYGPSNGGLGLGFLKDNSGFHTIAATSMGAIQTLIYGNNNQGVMVGEFSDSSYKEHGLVYDGATFAQVDYPGATVTRVLDINTSGQLAGAYTDGSGRYHGFIATPQNADLAAISLTWDTAQGGVDFAYSVSGADLTQDTTAALYWASGTSADTILEPAATPIPIPSSTPVGATQTVHVSAQDLTASPPPDAKYLLLIVNPSGPKHVSESDESNGTDPNNLKSIPIEPKPDLAATSLTWDTAQGGVDYAYTISGSDLPKGATGALYWSTETDFNTGQHSLIPNSVITTATKAQTDPYTGHIDAATIGTHSTDANYNYLLFVLNSDDAVTESDGPSSRDRNNVASLPYADLSPLMVVGNFQLNDQDRRFEATGTILVGLKPPGGESFSPLIRVDGSVSYDQTTIQASGTISSEVLGVAVPLFQGSWTINVGQAETTVLNEQAPVPNQFSLAGTSVVISQIAFVEDDSGGSVELQGHITLPAAAGGITLAVEDPHKIVIDQNGVRLTGGTIQLPDVSIRVKGVLDVEVESLSLEYIAGDPSTNKPDTFKLQGKIRVPAVYNFEANFVDPNYIQIVNGAVDLVGKISADHIDLTPGWSLENVELGFDTVNGAFGGTAILVMPAGVRVSATIAFVVGRNGQGVELDHVGLQVVGLNEPIGTTGAFLQSINGDVSHIAQSDPTPTLFHGSVGVTAGPQIDIRLATWAGGEITGSLMGIGATADIDRNHLTATGTVSVAGGLAAGASASVELNWDQDFLRGNGDFKLLGGTIDASASFQTSSSLNVTMDGSATIQLPPVFPDFINKLLRKLFRISGTCDLSYTNGAPLTDDYVEAVVTATIIGYGPITLGERVDFEGNVTPISSLTSAPLANSSQSIGAKAVGTLQAFASGSATKTASQTFHVDPNTTRLLLTAQWANIGANPVFEIVAPDGKVYSTEELGKGSPVTVLSELSGSGYESLGVLKPLPGDWTIRSLRAQGSGSIQFGGFVDARPATTSLTSLTQDQNGHGVDINYVSSVGDSPATVRFFYTDKLGLHAGVPIASGIPATAGPNHLVWNTTNVRPGIYYIYAMSDDGKTPLAFSDSRSAIVVNVGGLTSDLPIIPRASGFGGGRDAFVTTRYNEVLGRAPEPAGLFFWSKQLASTVKPSTVARSFWHSRERKTLVNAHEAPPINLGSAFRDARQAWRQAVRLGTARHRGRMSPRPSTH
jgi:hypothetical protein